MSVDGQLWNMTAKKDLYANDSGIYQQAVLEQYKIYVEMADRISQRRGLTNTFFLTLNTGIFTLIGVFWRQPAAASSTWLAIPLVAVLAQCFAWFYLVRSYQKLNAAKFQVVGAIEEKLPASPYWRAEWAALGEGKDRTTYWPLTHIEKWIPTLFGIIYVAGFVAANVAS